MFLKSSSVHDTQANKRCEILIKKVFIALISTRGEARKLLPKRITPQVIVESKKEEDEG